MIFSYMIYPLWFSTAQGMEGRAAGKVQLIRADYVQNVVRVIHRIPPPQFGKARWERERERLRAGLSAAPAGGGGAPGRPASPLQPPAPQQQEEEGGGEEEERQQRQASDTGCAAGAAPAGLAAAGGAESADEQVRTLFAAGEGTIAEEGPWSGDPRTSSGAGAATAATAAAAAAAAAAEGSPPGIFHATRGRGSAGSAGGPLSGWADPSVSVGGDWAASGRLGSSEGLRLERTSTRTSVGSLTGISGHALRNIETQVSMDSLGWGSGRPALLPGSRGSYGTSGLTGTGGRSQRSSTGDADPALTAAAPAPGDPPPPPPSAAAFAASGAVSGTAPPPRAAPSWTLSADSRATTPAVTSGRTSQVTFETAPAAAQAAPLVPAASASAAASAAAAATASVSSRAAAPFEDATAAAAAAPAAGGAPNAAGDASHHLPPAEDNPCAQSPALPVPTAPPGDGGASPTHLRRGRAPAAPRRAASMQEFSPRGAEREFGPNGEQPEGRFGFGSGMAPGAMGSVSKGLVSADIRRMRGGRFVPVWYARK